MGLTRRIILSDCRPSANFARPAADMLSPTDLPPDPLLASRQGGFGLLFRLSWVEQPEPEPPAVDVRPSLSPPTVGKTEEEINADAAELFPRAEPANTTQREPLPHIRDALGGPLFPPQNPLTNSRPPVEGRRERANPFDFLTYDQRDCGVFVMNCDVSATRRRRDRRGCRDASTKPSKALAVGLAFARVPRADG